MPSIGVRVFLFLFTSEEYWILVSIIEWFRFSNMFLELPLSFDGLNGVSLTFYFCAKLNFFIEFS
jgi:hypothetical protein